MTQRRSCTWLPRDFKWAVRNVPALMGKKNRIIWRKVGFFPSPTHSWLSLSVSKAVYITINQHFSSLFSEQPWGWEATILLNQKEAKIQHKHSIPGRAGETQNMISSGLQILPFLVYGILLAFLFRAKTWCSLIERCTASRNAEQPIPGDVRFGPCEWFGGSCLFAVF